jgi:hypothetical protein
VKIPVVNRAGDLVLRVHSGEMERMLLRKQARLSDDGRMLLLLDITGAAPDTLAGRTHTSRGGLLAAVGRSQQYTTANGRGQVDGFKTIYPEDRDIFRSAILDCVTV